MSHITERQPVETRGFVDFDIVPLVIALIAQGFFIGKFGRGSLWEVNGISYILEEFWFRFLIGS